MAALDVRLAWLPPLGSCAALEPLTRMEIVRVDGCV